MSNSDSDCEFIEIAGEGVVPASVFNKVIIQRDSCMDLLGRMKDICDNKDQELHDAELAIEQLKGYVTAEMIENRDNNIAHKEREAELMTTCMNAMKKMKEALEQEKDNHNKLQKIYDNMMVD